MMKLETILGTLGVRLEYPVWKTSSIRWTNSVPWHGGVAGGVVRFRLLFALHFVHVMRAYFKFFFHLTKTNSA